MSEETRSTQLHEDLTALWREIFEIPETDEVDPEESLFEAGGTSLQAVRLMTRIDETYGVKIPLPVVFAEGSVGRLAELVEEGLLDLLGDLTEEEALRLLQEETGGTTGTADAGTGPGRTA
ncbi:acyl carrier protein [Streptomyces vilmorinianum]|uniref:acyl carrier protein n=1 Tax=Streptomyces vilmorinianum TaxID=3051092 RepID=UPI0010FAD978|nr:acyl carrier protein [Streptomyces vilmorinianum]